MSEHKTAIVERMKSKLDEWGSRIEDMKLRADRSPTGVQGELRKRVSDLQAMRQDVEMKIIHLRRTGDEAWNEVHSRTEDAWEELGDAVKTTAVRFHTSQREE